MNKKILIVDDDDASSFIFKKNLKELGVECDCVKDGASALEYLNEKQIPILILLDVMLPDISGTDVLLEIRKHWDNIHLPVIMITHNSEEEDIVNALTMGANDYITKPLNINIAKARIKTQLTIHDLSEKSVELKETETLNRMITTYNHEINNPLGIILGNLSLDPAKMTTQKLEKIQKNVIKINSIVKKIKNLETDERETVNYSGNQDMFKINL